MSEIINNRTSDKLRNAAVLFGSTLTVMAGATIAPSLPQMEQIFAELPNHEYLIKLVLTMPAIFIAIISPFCGIILDKFGRKNIFILGIILYAIAGVSGFFLDNLYLIILGRGFLGIAVACIMTTCTTLIGDYFKGSVRDKFMGLQNTFIAFGGVVFIVGGGMLADISWRFPFLIYITAFFVLPLVIFYINEPINTSDRKNKIKIIPNKPIPWNYLAIIYFISFSSMALLYVAPVHLPFLLTESYGITNTHMGITLATVILFAGISSIYYSKVRILLSYRNIFILSFALVGVGYLLVGLNHFYYLLLGGLVIAGLGQGLLMPNIGVWILNVAPDFFRGRAIGGLTMFIFLGQFFCPLLTQPIVNMFNLASTFTVAALCSFGFCIFFYFKKKIQTATNT